jgi:hypothetical protein
MRCLCRIRNAQWNASIKPEMSDADATAELEIEPEMLSKARELNHAEISNGCLCKTRNAQWDATVKTGVSNKKPLLK